MREAGQPATARQLWRLNKEGLLGLLVRDVDGYEYEPGVVTVGRADGAIRAGMVDAQGESDGASDGLGSGVGSGTQDTLEP